MYFENKKCIFVHIPKTGGSSLEYAICSDILDTKENVQNKAYHQFSIRGSKMKEKWGSGKGHIHSYISEYNKFLPIEEYTKFCVLRNPFDQIRSLYNQIKKIIPIPSFEHFIMGDDYLSIKNKDHYINQYEYTHINDQLAIDKIFVFDRYYEAQNFVEDFFKIKIDREKKLWQTTYTQEEFTKEMKQKFESIYHKSIELYDRFLKDK